MALTVHMGWEIRQLDVVAAYFYGLLDEEVYMKQAELFDWFFDHHPDLAEKLNWSPTKVMHLKRALYGLKQPGRQWQKHFSGILVSIGMSSIVRDKGSYYGRGVLVVTHVDDSVYVGKKVDLDIFE